jgi:hypothetical protein
MIELQRATTGLSLPILRDTPEPEAKTKKRRAMEQRFNSVTKLPVATYLSSHPCGMGTKTTPLLLLLAVQNIPRQVPLEIER